MLKGQEKCILQKSAAEVYILFLPTIYGFSVFAAQAILFSED